MPETIALIATFAATAGTTALASTAIFYGVSGALYAGLSFGLSYLSSLLRPKPPGPEDVQTSTTNPIAPRTRHYGRVKISGPPVFKDSKDGDLHKVLALGTGRLDAIEEYWADDNVLTLDGDGVVIEPEQYDENLVIRSRLGLSTETVYSELTAVFPEWDADHRGDGVSSLYALQDASPPEKFSQRFPRGAETLYRVVARASRVYNVATATFGWSDNAALIIRDYIIHKDGMRLPSSIVNTPQAEAGWIAAYNRCDEAVNLKAGGTEPRYRIWGSYRFDERPADVLGRIMSACDARFVPTPDGGITIGIGTWAEPDTVIDEATIVGFSELARGRDVTTTANTVRATFTSPMHDYTSTDADPWIDDDDVGARGEISTDIAFPMAPSHGQTRRLMKLHYYRSNPNWIGVFQCNLKAMKAFGKRLIRIDYPAFGIDEVFEVQEFRFNFGEGNILTSVTLRVQSMPAEAYAWNAAAEEGDPPIYEAPVVDRSIPMPADFGFAPGSITTAGATLPVGVLTFDAPPSPSLKTEGRYKLVSESEWTPVPISPGATSVKTGPISSDEPYEAQVRHTTITGRQGEWTPSETINIASTPPEALTSFAAVAGLGHAAITIGTPSDDNLRKVILCRAPVGVSLDIVAHAFKTLAVPPSSTINYTDGDTTRANLCADPGFDTPGVHAIGSGWAVSGGVATKSSGTGDSYVDESFPSLTIGAVYRMAVTVTAVTASGVRMGFTGGTQVTTPVAFFTAGQHLGSITTLTGNNRFGVRGASFRGSVDDLVLFQQTAQCAPQGVWDFYAVPINGSGVAGPASGPLTRTII